MQLAINKIFKFTSNKNNSGFSLIELMVVVAIIGILASVAVPAYDAYMVRSKLTHLVSAANQAKNAISEFKMTQSNFPTREQAIEAYSIPPNTRYFDANASLTYPVSCSANSGQLITYSFTIKGDTNVNGSNIPTVIMTGVWTPATATVGARLTWSCVVRFANQVPAGFSTSDCPRQVSANSAAAECIASAAP